MLGCRHNLNDRFEHLAERHRGPGTCSVRPGPSGFWTVSFLGHTSLLSKDDECLHLLTLLPVKKSIWGVSLIPVRFCLNETPHWFSHTSTRFTHQDCFVPLIVLELSLGSLQNGATMTLNGTHDNVCDFTAIMSRNSHTQT